jgi:hypothetical protein
MVVLWSAGCGGAIVHGHPETAAAAAASARGVVSLPVRLAFGRAADQRRATRRTGDATIRATGGRAFVAEEFTGHEPEQIAAALSSLGEDPAHILTFSILAAKSERLEAMGMPNASIKRRPVYRFADYTVRLDVRHADNPQIIGSIETFASAFANAPELDAKGNAQGLQRAIEDAIAQAVRSFAPQLAAGVDPLHVVEAPASETPQQGLGAGSGSGALGAVERLRKLQVLYPERPLEELAALATSEARFLVVSPGRLAALGVAQGDLLSGVAGRHLGSRGAFARVLASGATPAMRVERQGTRFLVGQSWTATAAAPAAPSKPALKRQVAQR